MYSTTVQVIKSYFIGLYNYIVVDLASYSKNELKSFTND